MRITPLTKVEELEAKKLYKEGLSIKAIAEKFGKSETSISYIVIALIELNEDGNSTQRRSVYKSKRKRIVELYDRDMPINDIAMKLKVSEVFVKSVLYSQ